MHANRVSAAFQQECIDAFASQVAQAFSRLTIENGPACWSGS
jgi:hypothetical protein